jgi:hypothetical protein
MSRLALKSVIQLLACVFAVLLDVAFESSHSSPFLPIIALPDLVFEAGHALLSGYCQYSINHSPLLFFCCFWLELIESEEQLRRCLSTLVDLRKKLSKTSVISKSRTAQQQYGNQHTFYEVHDFSLPGGRLGNPIGLIVLYRLMPHDTDFLTLSFPLKNE